MLSPSRVHEITWVESMAYSLADPSGFARSKEQDTLANDVVLEKNRDILQYRQVDLSDGKRRALVRDCMGRKRRAWRSSFGRFGAARMAMSRSLSASVVLRAWEPKR